MHKNNIQQDLASLQTMRASTKLHARIVGMVHELPSTHTGIFFPLVAFRVAVTVVVVLLFIGIGSGVVVAAKESPVGSPLYPIRQLLEKTPSVQVMLPVRTPQPTHMPTPKAVIQHSLLHEDVKPSEIPVKKEHTVLSIKDQAPQVVKHESRVEQFFRQLFHGTVHKHLLGK